MANIAIFRINYKSDFILALNSDAGWLTPFCIKFWTGAPSQAYFVGFDGTTYTHCVPVAGEPTKLLVQFDDHHLPIGDLKFQIGYHFTVADFPTSVEDEVINQASVIIEVDGAPAKVMLDLNGETAPEIEFSLSAYANEAQRIENEQQRIENEQQRIDNEQQRIDNEQTRQRNEETRIENEQQRVLEFGQMKGDLEQATRDAAAAAENANEKGVYAKNQGDYAKQQGYYAKQQGDTAKADHERAEEDHRIAGEDHTQAGSDHTRAGEDHTQAGSDHTRAGEDHTLAGDDHTRAESDHTRAESDHAAVEVYVDSLGAFDISAYHATGGVLAKYADLTAALGTNGANIPEALRKGGMSVKFVQSSDNKYVQFRYMSEYVNTTAGNNAFANPNNWISDDIGLYLNNPQIRPIGKWTLYGYWINSQGAPVAEYDHWNAYRISPIGILKIRVKGLANYQQSRICFYNGEISENGLISMEAINSTDSGWIDIPKCEIIVISFKTVDPLDLSFSYAQDTVQEIQEKLNYKEIFTLVQGVQLKTDGTETEHTGYSSTEKIEIKDGDIFNYALTTYFSSGFVLYDEDELPIAEFLTTNSTYTGSYKVDLLQYPLAKYIRFCTTTATLSTSYANRNRNDVDFVYKRTIENKNGIIETNEKIRLTDEKIPTVELSDKYVKTYLNTNTLTLTSLSGWTTYRFPVKASWKYRVSAQINGGHLVVLVGLESSDGVYSVIDTGVGTGLHVFDAFVNTLEDTEYIIISQNDNLPEPFILDSYFPSDVSSSDIVSAWTQMVESDEFIEKVYFPRVFNSRYIIEGLFDYGNIHITENFVKPSLNNTVTVVVNDATKLNAGRHIAVGNYQTYDHYVVTAVSGNNVTIRLYADLSDYYSVGNTIPAVLSTSYESKELIDEYSCNVYNWGDILSLQSQNIPYWATSDGVHPTTDVYNIFGKALADAISKLITDETRIVVYGDSWGYAGIYPQKIETELGITVLNKSRSGDSTMYIRKRFLEDFNNNVVSNSDFFIFQMGTNNLLRWGAESGTSFVGPVGQIMKDYKFHFAEDCRKITSVLHKGNYIIVPGHAGATAYNPNL